MKMIEEKAHGKVKPEPKAKRAPREAEVIDFASLLEKSLGAKRKGTGEAAGGRRAANDEHAGGRRAKAPAAKARKKPAATHRRAA
jgi:non-homologous end joining protein Ku